MVYFYDHVLVQYALKQNMAEEGVQFKIMQIKYFCVFLLVY